MPAAFPSLTGRLSATLPTANPCGELRGAGVTAAVLDAGLQGTGKGGQVLERGSPHGGRGVGGRRGHSREGRALRGGGDQGVKGAQAECHPPSATTSERVRGLCPMTGAPGGQQPGGRVLSLMYGHDSPHEERVLLSKFTTILAAPFSADQGGEGAREPSRGQG